MHSDARRAPNFLWENPQTPRQGSRLRSFAVADCAGHNLNPSKKLRSPIKILDLATGPILISRIESIRRSFHEEAPVIKNALNLFVHIIIRIESNLRPCGSAICSVWGNEKVFWRSDGGLNLSWRNYIFEWFKNSSPTNKVNKKMSKKICLKCVMFRKALPKIFRNLRIFIRSYFFKQPFPQHPPLLH